MTKFDSVQISHRKGKQASTYTTAELRKNMAVFKATGVHPELEQRAASAAEAAPGLPASDAERPHVFFELVRISATRQRETPWTRKSSAVPRNARRARREKGIAPCAPGE